MKSILDYIKSNKLIDGISCILFTKNNQDDIDDLLISLKDSKIDELLVSDEFSTDKTVEKLRKYTNKIYHSKDNFLNRQKELLKNVKYKYLIIIEADQRLTKNYAELMLQEFKDLKCDILQSLLRIKDPKNYYEGGMEILYQFIKQPGKSNYFTGPCITFSELMIDLMNETKINSNSSIDTTFNEILRNNNKKIFTSNILAYQYEDLTYKKLKEKFSWYGIGDFYFYKLNKNDWGILRKIKSLTHVSLRYFIILPFFSLKKLKPHYIFFFYLCGVIRYIFFIREHFR